MRRKALHHTSVRGRAFEEWIHDIIKPLAPDAKITSYHQHFDITFTNHDTLYILECKCFSLKEKRGHIGQITMGKTQIKRLSQMTYPLLQPKHIIYVGGILLTPYDVYPIVYPLETAIELAQQTNGAKKVYLRMTQALRRQSLRGWLAQIFGVKQGEIHFPEFREYITKYEKEDVKNAAR